ncbi:MAG: DUF5915 domain-containing protein, partial [Propionicimonas sp.]
AALAASLAASGTAEVEVGGDLGTVSVSAEEVIISERPREGWSVVNEQGETVALDLELTPELVTAGLAREVIRLVQEARKTSGFEVSDRITVTYAIDDSAAGRAIAAAIATHQQLIADEVLAVALGAGEPSDGWFGEADLGVRFGVQRA